MGFRPGKKTSKKICARASARYIANDLQHQRRHFNSTGERAIAALLVALILFIDVMAACPALHELIHHDADEPGHECAVTMFAHGQVESVTVDVPPAPPTAAIEVAPRIFFSVFRPVIQCLPPGRGPPAVSSPTV
jgi:hypothetical protein